MRRDVITIAVLTSFAASVALARAAELSGTEIMTRVEQREIGKDERSEITLTLITKEGQRRERKMILQRRGKADSKKVLIHFLSPADVRGVGFLVWRHPGKDDDRWLFLPALNMVRRIAAADKRSSFVGSDFVYEDVAGRDVGQDTHTLVRSESLGGQDCYVVKSVPKNPGSAEFSYKLSWVRKDNFVVIQELYYDKRGEQLKKLTVDKLEAIQGIPTVRKQTMRDLQTGHRSEVTYDDVRYNLGLGDDVFTERYLRRAP
jgi:outer membrane lipoprotein-sorting protein